MKLRGRCLCALRSCCDGSPDVYRLSLGCFQMDPGVRATMHIHVRSMAPWFEITGALTRYEKAPPR